jgi:hypothetical protein
LDVQRGERVSMDIDSFTGVVDVLERPGDGMKVAVDDEVLGGWKLGTGSELENCKRS